MSSTASFSSSPTVEGDGRIAVPLLVDSPAVPQRQRELVASLRSCDPLRGAFDVVVRRYVRDERARGRHLDEVLADLRQVLRAHVEPAQPAARRVALRTAVLWFAVSEYHRAD
jgi:hypothetical protein